MNYILRVVNETENSDHFYGPYDFDTAVELGKDWTNSTHAVTMYPIVEER